jgi:hypothetical protein
MKLVNVKHAGSFSNATKSSAFALLLALAATPLIATQMGCTGRNAPTTTTGSVAPATDRTVGDTSVNVNAPAGTTSATTTSTTATATTGAATDPNLATTNGQINSANTAASTPTGDSVDRAPASVDSTSDKMEGTAVTQKSATSRTTGRTTGRTTSTRAKMGARQGSGMNGDTTSGTATGTTTSTSTTTDTAGATGASRGDQSASTSGGAPYHGAKAGTTNKNLSQMSPGTTDQHTDQNPVDSSAPSETARHGKRK